MHGGNPGARANAASWPEVRVACVWLPQLPLRMEVLRHPAWDGRPLVLAGGPGEGRVVKLCSPEAERAGIRPGLPLREVLALCREAIILQPDPVRIEALLRELLGKLQRVSPAVELGAEHLFLDLRGLRGVYRGDLGLLERAVRAVVPLLLQPRIGVAGGPFTALVAARLAPPSGMRVVPSPETAKLLAPLPIGFLPLPPDALRRLDLLGLRSIADLAALPFAAVQA
ncbi:MAG: DNA polymerase Y family protein, partial [Chloroflexi bacterium]|nr:DNA polymerase Y family protein [Chloroflexota bacterium]